MRYTYSNDCYIIEIAIAFYLLPDFATRYDLIHTIIKVKLYVLN